MHGLESHINLSQQFTCGATEDFRIIYSSFFLFIYFFLDLLYGDRTVTYFSLDTDEDRKDEQLFNPKQKVYSECVEDAVKDLLVSPEIDAQLKDCPIEIVDVSNFFFCFD